MDKEKQADNREDVIEEGNYVFVMHIYLAFPLSARISLLINIPEIVYFVKKNRFNRLTFPRG